MQFTGEPYCWNIALHRAGSLLLVLYFVTDGTGVWDPFISIYTSYSCLRLDGLI
jgi:hypothetical protein